MDPESQFYSFIHTSYMSNYKNSKEISSFINYSFHGCSHEPTALHQAWDLKK